MEDVIDEFVEEINEEDELEHQIVERQLVEGQPVEVQQQDGQLAQGQLGEGQMVEEKTRRKRKRGRIDDSSKNDNSTKNAPKRRKRRETKNVEGQVNKPRQSEKEVAPAISNSTVSDPVVVAVADVPDLNLLNEGEQKALDGDNVSIAKAKNRKRKRGKTRGKKEHRKKQRKEAHLERSETEAQTDGNPSKTVAADEEVEDVAKIAEFLQSQTPSNTANGLSSEPSQISQEKNAKQGSVVPNEKETGNDEIPEQETSKKVRKRGQKSKRSKSSPTDEPQVREEPPATSETTPGQSSSVFKPISDWKKVLKFPANYSDLSTKVIEQQIYKNPLPPYVPCVPKNTSQNLIENLSEKEVEQLGCPGCKDRFLIPSMFFQHLYRKSVRITFNCKVCGTMSFYNRCHLRTHVLSHLEVDGTTSVTMQDSESLTITPLEQSEFNVGFIDDSYGEELDLLHREQSRSGLGSIQCSECRLTFDPTTISAHFRNFPDQHRPNFHECQECKMTLPNRCSLSAHQRIHKKCPPFVCPGYTDQAST